MAFYDEITVILTDEKRRKREEPMRQHTTFRVGGPAEFFLTVQTVEELTAVLALCRQYKQNIFLIGNGSNLLVSDRGVRGVVLKLSGDFAKLKRLSETELAAGAAVLLSTVAVQAAREGNGGLSFAAGIPGSVGGAVVMNAGAYGSEMKDVITRAELCSLDGTLSVLKNEELKLSYRHSILSEQEAIVTRVWFTLPKEEPEKVLREMEELQKKRREKQPLEFPSAGSTFKRPEGYFAGKLIMEAGLQGFSIGDAEISKKHCGFVVNKGNATAEDIFQVICETIRIVKKNSGVTLTPEIKLLGEFKEG